MAGLPTRPEGRYQAPLMTPGAEISRSTAAFP
jgi:hypothetical protein